LDSYERIGKMLKAFRDSSRWTTRTEEDLSIIDVRYSTVYGLGTYCGARDLDPQTKTTVQQSESQKTDLGFLQFGLTPLFVPSAETV
jgi:hypothetical protein